MAKYHLDRAAFRAELLNAPWMVAEMDARAQRGYELAESIAPEKTGDYKASFVITSGTNGGIHHDRAHAELANTSPHAAEVEWGNGRPGSEGHHVLIKALDAMR